MKEEKVKILEKELKEIYKILSFFIKGTKEDRLFFKKNTNPLLVYKVGTILNCIGDEDLFQDWVKMDKVFNNDKLKKEVLRE